MSTITLSNTVNRTYTLIDKDSKYYLQSWYNDNGYQNQINLASIHEGQEEYIRPQALALDNIINLKKTLKDIAPIDMRVFIDNAEITEDARKSEIFKSLTMFEYRTESTSMLKSMTEQSIKAAKEENALRSQLITMVSSMNRNVSGMSVSKCKKLKAALKELQGS